MEGIAQERVPNSRRNSSPEPVTASCVNREKPVEMYAWHRSSGLSRPRREAHRLGPRAHCPHPACGLLATLAARRTRVGRPAHRSAVRSLPEAAFVSQDELRGRNWIPAVPLTSLRARQYSQNYCASTPKALQSKASYAKRRAALPEVTLVQPAEMKTTVASMNQPGNLVVFFPGCVAARIRAESVRVFGGSRDTF